MKSAMCMVYMKTWPLFGAAQQRNLNFVRDQGFQRIRRQMSQAPVVLSQCHETQALQPSALGDLDWSRHALPTWTSLGVGQDELTLDYCLPTGQSFRWYQEGPGTFTGVIGQRLVCMRQTESDSQYLVMARGVGAHLDDDDLAVREYFNLHRGGGTGVSLIQLGAEWSKACKRYAHIRPHIPGARMLRQHPIECLFEFICSSNNHISRIHGMVQHLCEAYGTPLVPLLPSVQDMDLHMGSSTPHIVLHPEASSDGPGNQPQPQQQTPLAVDMIKAESGMKIEALSMEAGQGSATPQRSKRRRSTSPVALPAVAIAMPMEPDQAMQGVPSDQAQAEAALSAGIPLQPSFLMGGSSGASLMEEQGPPDVTPVRPHRGRKGGGAQAAAHDSPASFQGQGMSVTEVDIANSTPLSSLSSNQSRSTGSRSAKATRRRSVSPAKASPVKPAPSVYYAFPTLDQLSKATDEDLRAAGFGYRAKFIVKTVEALMSKPEGGEAWLMSLRERSYEEAAASLIELPGVGPKVAACVCLFALDKHEAIPVDTHVWQIATQYYLPSLKGKALTKKVHGDVQDAFVKRFGPYAGWAHNALFISELAAHKHRIPPYKG